MENDTIFHITCQAWAQGFATLESDSRRVPRGVMPLGTNQAAVLDAVRLVRVRALPPLQVFDVFLVVPFVPHHLAVALEREHVRRDAVEEPAVVRDDHRAA